MRGAHPTVSHDFDVEDWTIVPQDLVMDMNINRYNSSNSHQSLGTQLHRSGPLHVAGMAEVLPYTDQPSRPYILPLAPLEGKFYNFSQSPRHCEDKFTASSSAMDDSTNSRARSPHSQLNFGRLSLRENSQGIPVQNSLSQSVFDLNQDTIFDRLQASVLDSEDRAFRQHSLHYHGYEPETLMDTVAIHCRPCRPSNLQGPSVLHIFKEEMFHDVPCKIYETMRPAMALAERFILKGSIKFWVGICCGSRRYSIVAGIMHESLESCLAHTESQFSHTLERLQQLGKLIRWGFQDVVGGYARSRPVRASRALHSRMDPWSVPHDLHLDTCLYHTLVRYATLRHPDPAAKLRFDFFLAVVLCHEIAHAFEVKCGDHQYLRFLETQNAFADFRSILEIPDRKQEAIWTGDAYAEAGAKWEIFTFGDRIKPINHGCDIRYGLVLYNGDWFDCNLFNETALKRVEDGKYNSLVISMGYIEETQQEEFWAPPGVRNLRPPRFGPSNVFVGTDTSTMSWRRYLLDKEKAGADGHDDDDFSMHYNARHSPYITSHLPLTPLLRLNLQTPIQMYSEGFDYSPQLVRAAMRRYAHLEQRDYYTTRASQIADEERRCRYKDPGPYQPDLHEYFHYPGSPTLSTISTDSDDQHNIADVSYDALSIPSGRLRTADKWMLTEELFCFQHNSDSANFLAHRMRDTLGLAEDSPVNPHNSNSWSETEKDILKQLRKQDPARGFPAIELKKREARRKNRERWRIINEMEELCVYSGHSRIEFQRAFSRNNPLPFGMTVRTFDECYRELLITKRQEYDGSHTLNTLPSLHPDDVLIAPQNQGMDPGQDEALFRLERGEDQSKMLDNWLVHARTKKAVTSMKHNGNQLPGLSAPTSLKPSPNEHQRLDANLRQRKTSFDKVQYQQLQTAAAQGRSGLYSFLRG